MNSGKNWFLKMASSVVGENLTTEETLLAAQNHIQQLRYALQNAQYENDRLRSQHDEAMNFILAEQQKGVGNLAAQQRQTELRLQQSLLDLDTLRASFQQHIGRQAEENQRLIKQIEWLSGTIAHDMRTPIRAIDAYTFFLEDDLGDALTEDAKKSLAEVRRNGHRISVLVEGLIEYMRIALVPVLNEPLDAAGLLAPLLDEHSFTHQCAIEGQSFMVRGDRALITQAFRHLLDNAQKFSGRQTSPAIQVRLDATSRSIQIADNGIGFDQKHADKLFRLFHRLHGNDEFPGEGLGLCLAQRMLMRFDATLDLQAADGWTCAKTHWPA
jgi:light-regulated signal transduction histidine kinase (bacteriophytochrome)